MNRFALAICLLALPAFAQAQAPPTLTGKWTITLNFAGTTFYNNADFEQHGNQLGGRFTGDKLEGTINGATVHFISKSDDGTTDEVHATLTGNMLSGTLEETSPDAPKHPAHWTFTASPTPPLEHKTPQRHDFTPTVFYRQFSPLNQPVLRVAPGDTIHTTTVDAGGQDEHSIARVIGGNPETGPFYVIGANPGDTLVVHIVHLKLNRDWAQSDDNIVDRGLNSDLAIKTRDNGKAIRWHLDLANGTASPEKPGNHMKSFSIPVKPMLGCIATAPNPGNAPPATGDSGPYGGNMDFNEIGEGATVYLPVSNPGALLYFGDAHALQGDGEMNGNALETSMDVEVTVDVIPNTHLRNRRIETPDAIIAMGLQGSLDDAFKEATANMAQWLTEDYKLTPSEVAQFIGVASEYHISEAADRNAGIVLKIAKAKLARLTPVSK